MSEIERGETEKKGAKMNPDMEAALRDAYAHAEVLSRGGQEKEDTQEEGADVTQRRRKKRARVRNQQRVRGALKRMTLPSSVSSKISS